MSITLDALRVLDAIERKKSFAGAAQALHRVPSAISYTVSKLEEDLGVEVFDRSKRRAVLTAAGRLLLEQGRQILLASDALAQRSKAVAGGWEAELTIAVDSALSFLPLYELVRDFQSGDHNTELIIREEVLGGSWEALIEQRCDLVIGAEGSPPPGQITTHVMGEMNFVFAVAASHPLCDYPEPLGDRDIVQFPTVVVADSSRYTPGRSVGLLDGRSRLTVPSIEQKIEAHLLGLGVGYLPEHRIGDLVKAGELRVLELESRRPPLVISAAWRQGFQGKALKWFIDRIQTMNWKSD